MKKNLIIIKSEVHNLTYDIKKKQGLNWVEITDDKEKKIFYKDTKYDEKLKKHITDESSESFLITNNWVLAKIKPINEDNYFYVFINNIKEIRIDPAYCCLGVNNKIEDFYFIYSGILLVDSISRTLPGYNTQLVNINFKGLNFVEDTDINMKNWFENANNLKNIHNFPKLKKEINIRQMLTGCKSLENVDLGENKINDAFRCFSGCENLKNVNLENISITKNARLCNMFYNCKILGHIRGISTLVKKDDKPDVKYMFSNAVINKRLNLSEWGTNIIPLNMFINAKIKNLILFDIKSINKNFEETKKNNEKKIREFNKKIDENNNEINKKNKEIEDINKQPETDENKKKKNDITNEIEKLKYDVDKLTKDINNRRAQNGIQQLEILNNAEVDKLCIKEEFMPKKEDLDKIIGNNCTVKMLYIVDKDGNYKKYEGFDNYKNGIEYKDPKPDDDDNKTNDDQQIQEDPQQNIENVELPKSNHCFSFCAQCCIKCCCCCPNNNNLLGKKRNRE